MTTRRDKRFLLLAVLFLSVTGGVVSWSSWRQPALRTSSTQTSENAPLQVAFSAQSPAGAELSSQTSVAQSADAKLDPVLAEFETWARNFNAQTASESEMKHGVELAEKRNTALKQLIVNKPEQALQSALSYELRQKMPADISRHLERRISARGTLGVMVTTPTSRGELARVSRNVTIKDEIFKAYVYGKRSNQPTMENTPLHGIAIGDVMAVHESPVRILEPNELPDPSKRIVNPDGKCPIKGVASRDVTVDAGDEIYYTCCSSCPSALSSQLGGTNSSSSTTANSSWTEGAKTVLFIRVDFSDLPGEQITQANAEALINTTVNNFYVDNSYGKTSMTCTATSSVLRLPQLSTFYANNFGSLVNDARSAANSAGYNDNNYSLDVIGCAYLGNGAAGQGYVGAKGSVLYGYFDLRVAAHELGHNYGVWHANYWSCGDTVIGAGSNEEYGDSYTVMGFGDNSGQLHFNTYMKSYFNWLTSTQVTTVNTNGTYRIYSFDQALSSGQIGALHVAKAGDANGRVYWGGFRQKITGNKWLMNGLDLHWAPWGSSNGGTSLLDTTGGSSQGKNDSAVVIGRTFADTVSGVYITPIGKGGTTPESLDVVVNVGTFPGNQPPVVSSLNPSATSVTVGTTVNFTATASDPNGDTMAYYWDFGDGNFGTNSPNASKSWGATGEYVVRCTVSDMKGGEGAAWVIIQVGNPTPARISGQVTDGANGIEGVRVYVDSTNMAYTDSAGNYVITNLSGTVPTASDGGDSWFWVSSNPAPFSGSKAHQSNISGGEHQHYFTNASNFPIGTGDSLFTYVYLDPSNPPTEVMLQFNVNGDWSHRAYWGANSIGWGTDGTVSKYYAGVLPGLGQWVRLEVPASAVGLEGLSINGMAYTLNDGRATWDLSGKKVSGGGDVAWFDDALPSVTYTVAASKLNWSFTPSGFTNPVATNSTGVNFLGTAPMFPVSGTVTDEGTPVSGVTISNGSRTATTDGSGNYTLNLPDGAHTLTATKAGYTFVTNGWSNPVSVADAAVTGRNFSTPLGSISGQVTDNGSGISGVTVSNGSVSATTNGSGNYTILHVPFGTFTLTATKPGYTLNPSSFSNPVTMNSNLTNMNFYRPLNTISGEITGVPKTGTLPTVHIGDGVHSTSAYTSGNGANKKVFYSLQVPDGSWNIYADLSAYTITPSNFTNPITVNGASQSNMNMNGVNTTTYKISGTVSTSGGAPISGVVISNGTGSCSTDTLGNYTLINVANGTYTLTPTKAGYAFSPTTQSATVSSANVTGKNFTGSNGNTPPTISNIADQSTNEDTATSAIAFTVGDAETAAGSLTVSGTSSNTTLVPNANIVFGGSGANRTITLTPAANQNGTSTITVTVSDGISTANDTFILTVNAVNDAPVANNQSVSTNEDTAKAITLVATDVENNTLTYTIVAGPTHGSLSGSAPNVTYTPAANYNGPDSFTFKANDGALDSNVATVSITVNAVNDVPVANNQSVTTAEDTAKAITLTATDVENSPLTYTIVAAPTHGTLSGSAPNVTYTPAANYNGADSFTFKANDGTVDSNVATVSITVTAVNDAPVANNQSVNTNKNTAVGITLTATDIDSGALTYSIVSGPSSGTLSGSPPNVTYTPNNNFVGNDSFTFKANDGGLDSNTATVSITVVNPNTAPVANNQSVTTAEDTAKAITLTATDADNNPLTYSIVASPTHGTLSGTAPNVTYTPAANYNGADSFTFKANDGTVDSNTATVSITVTPVNDAPVANNQSVTTNEDTAKAITLVATDVDANPLTWTIVAGPTHGALSGSAPNLTYTPAANYNGADSFTFKVNDGTVDSNTATVSITVNAVNDAPVANNQNVTTAEDTAKAITLTATDVENSPLTYSIVANPTHGALSGTLPNVTYTPAANYNGPDSFTFKANDGTVDGNTATVSITVTPVNDAPVANNQSVTTNEDTAKAITLTATEVDGDPLTWTVVAGPTHGALSGSAPNLTYTPASNYNGADSFTFKVNDGTVDSNTATVSITVNAVNDAPVANNQSVTTAEDTAKAITMTATDVENSPLTYSIVANPTHGTLSGSAPSVTYTPAANYNGPDSFTFKANDGTANSNTATVSITVTPVNDTPVANNQSVTTNEDTAKAITLTASDVDSDPLTYTVVGNPTHGTLTGTAPNLTYTPNANYNGADSFTFKVNDGTVDSNTATITITVSAVNDAPVANNQSVTTLKNTAKAITLTATDVENSPLTYTVLLNPTNGTLSGTVPNLTYTPNANYTGSDSFTFRANDGSLNSNTATVSITVNNFNSAPVANNQSVTTAEDTAKAITLTASDVDVDPLTYSVVATPTHGTLSGTAPNLTYTPNPNYNGSDSFTFKANDGALDSNVATISITVTPVNDAPVVADQSVSTRKNTAVGITLSGSDVDGDALTFSVVASPAHGTLSGTAPNLSYTPAQGYSGADSFTFKANDGTVDSNTATVSINITRQAPTLASGLTASPNPATVGEAVQFPVSATDPDGDALTYAWDFGDGITDSNETVAHIYGVAGTYHAHVTVTDSDGLSVTSSVDVAVGELGASPPVIDNDNDGVSDSNELADGTNPNDPNSFVKTPMTVSKLQGKVSFTLSGKDSYSISGIIPNLPPLFNPAGVAVKIDVGGAVASFTLDAKARAVSTTGTFGLRLKPSTRNKTTKKVEFLGGPVAFKALVRGGSWAQAWSDEGVDPAANATKAPIVIIADLTMGGRVYTSTVNVLYSAKAGAGGKFKK